MNNEVFSLIKKEKVKNGTLEYAFRRIFFFYNITTLLDRVNLETETTDNDLKHSDYALN